jgi:ATP phosphoribosyltransferase regulatory subunit
VLHARPSGSGATREPLQFGAEIYGHEGLEADLEILDLALECLSPESRTWSSICRCADVRAVGGVPVRAHETIRALAARCARSPISAISRWRLVGALIDLRGEEFRRRAKLKALFHETALPI